jgi:streptogramin lyase
MPKFKNKISNLIAIIILFSTIGIVFGSILFFYKSNTKPFVDVIQQSASAFNQSSSSNLIPDSSSNLTSKLTTDLTTISTDSPLESLQKIQPSFGSSTSLSLKNVNTSLIPDSSPNLNGNSKSLSVDSTNNNSKSSKSQSLDVISSSTSIGNEIKTFADPIKPVKNQGIPTITATINQASGQADPTFNTPVNFEVKFSNAINPSTFTASDITLTGTSTGATVGTLTTTDNITWIFPVTVTTSGTIIANLATDTVADLTDNSNFAATFIDNQITYTLPCPVISTVINQASGQIDPTTLSPVKFTTVFSLPINPVTFTTSKIALTGTAPGKTVTSITEVSPNNGTTYEVAVSATGAGTVIVEVNGPAYVSTILGTTGGQPSNLKVDNLGNIYIANANSNNVTKMTPSGVSTILGTTGNRPINIALDNFGNVYTANNNSNNVTKITPAGVSTTLGTTGANPYGIVLDTQGNVYTANKGGSNITKITPSGVSTTFATTGNGPTALVFDFTGNLYTVNITSRNITKITPAGVSTTYGTTGTLPNGIVVDSLGNVYTSNNGSNNVSKITPGGVSTIFGTTGSGPYTMVIDSAGNLYVGNIASSNVSKITPNGVSTIIGNTGASPFGLAIDYANVIYTSNFSSNNVSKLAPSGITNSLGCIAQGSTSTDNTITIIDPTGPTATINQASGQADPTANTTVNFTAAFSEAINPTTFTASDITISGTATGATTGTPTTTDNITWNIPVTVSGGGTVIANFGANKVISVAGKGNETAIFTDNTITVDNSTFVTVNIPAVTYNPREPVLGTCEAGATVTITITIGTTNTLNQTLPNFVCDRNGTYSVIPISDVPNGNYCVNASSKDTLNNTASAQKCSIKDIPNFVTISVPSITNNPKPLITGTCHVGAIMEIKTTIGTANSANQTLSTFTCSASEIYSVNPSSNIPSGPFCANVKSTDLVTAASSTADIVTAQSCGTIDTSTFITVLAPTITNNPKPAIAGTCEVGGTVTIEITIGASNAVNETLSSFVCDRTGAYSINLTIDIPTGVYCANGTIVDVATNTATATASCGTIAIPSVSVTGIIGATFPTIIITNNASLSCSVATFIGNGVNPAGGVNGVTGGSLGGSPVTINGSIVDGNFVPSIPVLPDVVQIIPLNSVLGILGTGLVKQPGCGVDITVNTNFLPIPTANITGVRGTTFPTLTVVNNPVISCETATFQPLGSSNTIQGSIVNGNFVPNPTSGVNGTAPIIPLDAKLGTSSGTLKQTGCGVDVIAITQFGDPEVLKQAKQLNIGINDPYKCKDNIYGRIDTEDNSKAIVTVTLKRTSVSEPLIFTPKVDKDGNYLIPIDYNNSSSQYYVPEGVYTVNYNISLPYLTDYQIPSKNNPDTRVDQNNIEKNKGGQYLEGKPYTANIVNPVKCNPLSPVIAVLARTGGSSQVQLAILGFITIGFVYIGSRVRS